jgi:predicted DNA-binding transcriptional regulator AlpA
MATALLRFPDLQRLIGCSRSGIERLEKHDTTFPRRVQLGTRAVVWRESEVLNWIAKLPTRGVDDGPDRAA